MKYETGTDFRQALEQRLKVEAGRTELNLNRLRKRVTFELFLRRLLTVAPGRWVLKGAFALDLRFGAASRPTKDIDLGRDDSEDAAIGDMAAAQALAMDDYFNFSAERTTALDDTDDFTAIRFSVTAELAGRQFENFIVDIGFSDPLSPQADAIQTSDFLAFADIEPLRIPVISLTQHITEKVHAYTRRYGETHRESSRPKDLVDILLIASSESLDAGDLRDALVRTFEQRDTHPLPTQLPTPPQGWAAPYSRMAAGIGIETDLVGAYLRAALFLDPVLSGTAIGAWDPTAGEWTSRD